MYSKKCKRKVQILHIALLEKTSEMVKIFTTVNSKIESISDTWIGQLLSILEFFHTWEKEYINDSLRKKYLITRKTRQDIDSCIYGFLHTVHSSEINVPIAPGYINSDLIKNWFCQVRGPSNGFNQNPTLNLIGPAINNNIITGSVISKKGNSSGEGEMILAKVFTHQAEIKCSPVLLLTLSTCS